MKKSLSLLIKKFSEFWSRFGKYVFAAMGLLFAVVAGICCWSTGLIFALGLIASLIVFFCFLYANVPIETVSVRLGWAMISLAVFLTTTSLLTYNKIIPLHYFGLFAAVFVQSLLYSSIPLISYKLKLNDQKEGTSFFSLKTTNSNGMFGQFCLYMLILVIVGSHEKSELDDIKFEQEIFIPITKWEKEMHNGSTFYIISCPKGKFAISPLKYPEIRDINSQTKVKILVDEYGYVQEGLLNIKKIEIKNETYAGKY